MSSEPSAPGQLLVISAPSGAGWTAGFHAMPGVTQNRTKNSLERRLVLDEQDASGLHTDDHATTLPMWGRRRAIRTRRIGSVPIVGPAAWGVGKAPTALSRRFLALVSGLRLQRGGTP